MHAWRRGLARRRAARDRRAKILCVEPAGRCHHHDARRCNQGQMDLRTGAPADEGGTGPRPLRRQILDGVTPTCLDDDDRLRLPPIPPPQSSGTEKKESQDRHHSRACLPSGKPSSTSSCNLHPCDALIVKCSSLKPLNPKCQSSASGATQSDAPRVNGPKPQKSETLTGIICSRRTTSMTSARVIRFGIGSMEGGDVGSTGLLRRG